MLVLDSRKRVDIGLGLRLRKALAVLFLLTHLGIDIVDADDQAAAFRLLHHCGLDLDVKGSVLRDSAEAKCEDPAL